MFHEYYAIICQKVEGKMQKKTTKSRKAKTPISKSWKSVIKTAKASGYLSRKSSSKTFVVRNAASGQFVSAKTGRVVKLSPVTPRLGRKCIKTAVRNYVRRDVITGKFVAD